MVSELYGQTSDSYVSSGCVRDVDTNIGETDCELALVAVSVGRQERGEGQGTVEDERSVVVAVGGIVDCDVDS